MTPIIPQVGRTLNIDPLPHFDTADGEEFGLIYRIRTR
jgi:hypothetical protein